MGHRCCNKQKVKRGLWSPEEDERLLKHITCHGHGSWSSVPKLAGLQRCGKSCRLRWINYLRPDLKRGSFTPSEEQIIIDVHRILGNRWAQIAKHLPGRTDNEVKNFWNSCIKKKLISKGLDPKTHNLLSPHQRAALNITTTAAAAAAATNPAVLLNLQHHLHQQASSLLPCSFDHGSNMMSTINIITMDHHHHHHIPTLFNVQDDDSSSNHDLPLNETSPSSLLQQQQQQIGNYGTNVGIVNHDHDEAGLFWDGSTLDNPAIFELAAMGPEKEKVALNIDDDAVDQYDDQNNIAVNGDDHNYYDYYDQIAGIDHHHNHHEVASHDDQAQHRFDHLAFMDPSLVHGAMYAADHFVPMDDFAWNF